MFSSHCFKYTVDEKTNNYCHEYRRPATHTDFINLHTFFTFRIWQNTDFFSLKFGKIQIFFHDAKGFVCFFSIMQIVFPKILMFLVIYTDFVLDQSGRSGIVSRSNPAIESICNKKYETLNSVCSLNKTNIAGGGKSVKD